MGKKCRQHLFWRPEINDALLHHGREEGAAEAGAEADGNGTAVEGRPRRRGSEEVGLVAGPGRHRGAGVEVARKEEIEYYIK